MLFYFAPMCPKSYHIIGPQGTFFCYLVATGSYQKPWQAHAFTCIDTQITIAIAIFHGVVKNTKFENTSDCINQQ